MSERALCVGFGKFGIGEHPAVDSTTHVEVAAVRHRNATKILRLHATFAKVGPMLMCSQNKKQKLLLSKI